MRKVVTSFFVLFFTSQQNDQIRLRTEPDTMNYKYVISVLINIALIVVI